jgi:Tfp pilus assembly PilM family ATPase
MHLLALEWDQAEARVVVAQPRGGDVLIEHAFSVALAPRDPGQTFADISVGQRLLEALTARHISRVETIVAVGRSNIELRRLTLPPAPEDELPDLVRFGAVPHFSNLGEDWPLDFFPIESGSEGQAVLAAAISPALVKQIQDTCHEAALKPQRLVLRPCASASLVAQRGGPARHRIRLFVDLLAEEADLTVLVEKSIVLMRTVRMPAAGHADEQYSALLGEIRRTIAAAHNQLGADRVEQVVLCGHSEDHRQLAAVIGEKLQLRVDHFDPFAGLAVSRQLRSHPPEKPERFAPLLGMVLDEASGRRHAIDFLNPRKKAPPPSRRRQYVLAAATAAAVVLAALLGIWLHFGSLQRQRNQLQAQSNDLERKIKQSAGVEGQLREIEKWSLGDVNWLVELERLSKPEHFPPAKDARLAEWKTAAAAAGGQMTLIGNARQSEVISTLEQQVRDERHTVITGPSVIDKEDASYPWSFQEKVVVAPENAELYRKYQSSSRRTVSPARAGGRP